VKAVLLAGGFGTRLRPLSCTRPKLLFPLLGRPLVDFQLERLAQSGVDEVVIAVHHMAEILMAEIGDERYGMRIRYSIEQEPLGTGGAIRWARRYIGDEEFLAMNGDVVSDLDLRSLIDFHKSHDAAATIALYEVEDPRRFGVAVLEDDNRIRCFVEKPRDPSVGRAVNAGVYVLTPDVFRYLPEQGACAIERTAFPKLAEEGKLYGFVHKGLWLDVGLPPDYLRANFALLDRQGSFISEEARVSERATVNPPVYIRRGAVIEEDAHIGPYAIIDQGVWVGRGARIEECVVFPFAHIGHHASLRGAIVGEHARIGRWVKVETNCIISDFAKIGDNATLISGVRVCPYKEVRESIFEPRIVT